MGIEKVGTISFWLQHKHQDWPTNDQGYSFPTISPEGILVHSAKHPDGNLEITIAGPFDKRFRFSLPIPDCSPRGCHVVVRWKSPKVDLFLNGNLSQTVHESQGQSELD